MRIKSNTMQRVSPIINSQRQPNSEKSEYTHEKIRKLDVDAFGEEGERLSPKFD